MIGYRSFWCCKSEWRWHHGAVIPLTLPHAIQPMSGLDAGKLAIKHRAPFVRWTEAFDQLQESEWWHLIKDQPEAMESLSGNTRSKVRRGAKRFHAGPADRDSILFEGYRVYSAAFARYETFEEVLSEKQFREAVANLPPGTEFWAVRDKDSGLMVAFSENVVREGACFYNSIWLRPDCLKGYASYLLFHEMNKYYLNERGMRYVSDGARGISHDTKVHEFLEQKFGFRKAYSRLRVVYFPGVELLVKVLYPFKGWFKGRSSSLLQKVAIVLEQERIRRSFGTIGEKH